jgi:hypothetical protein
VAIAWRISGVGTVTVSERRSTTALDASERDAELGDV